MANQAIRQEINLLDHSFASIGTATPNELAQMDTAQYSGSPTYWFEIVHSGAASNTGTISVRNVTDLSSAGTINGATSATFIISRAQFTPAAGAKAYTVIINGDGVRTITVRSARIIILQSEAAISKTETQIEIGNTVNASTNTAIADMTNPKFWTYTAANWDGTKTFSVEVVWQTSAANTTTIRLCRTSDNATNVTIVSAQTNTTFTRTRVTFTPVDGETYKIRSLGSTTKSNYTIACGKIIVAQTATPTKLEPQFLLLNTNDTNATGVQNNMTTWNSSEWDAGTGTITYKHLMDSDNASNSAKIRDTTASSDIANSTVTGTGQQVSSALGAFTNTNTMDTWILNTTGVVAASKIQVIYAFVAAAARRIFVTGG